MKLFCVIESSNVRRAYRTKPKTLRLITAIAALAAIPTLVVFSAQQKFTTIDVPGATSTAAEGTNPQGDIVGLYFDSSGNGHGFLLSKGKFTTIDVPGAVYTEADSINAQGDIVGTYADSSGNGHGFLLSK